jgi:DNA-binding response OmpR family regulator
MTDKTVVIAEDDKHVRDILKINFTNQEWSVKLFEDGDDCLNYVKSGMDDLPDLVFLDVMMPNLNGISVLEDFKDHEKLRNIPVIILTSRSREEDIAKCIELGADDFISKPFEGDVVVEKARKAMSN